MAFKKKTWKDRLVEYAGRKKITNVSTLAAQIVDIERAEGVISEEGSAFDAANMNDFEQRVADGFAGIQQDVDGVISDLARVNTYVGSDGNLHFVNSTGADTVLPFKKSGYAKTQQYTNNWCNDGVSMAVNLSDCSWYRQATMNNIKCGISYVNGHGGNGANIVIETYVTNYDPNSGIAKIFIRGDILNPVILVCMIP